MANFVALGLIETFGLVFALEAADAMCKAADVELIGYENVASGYISILVSGDVGACQAAVEAGVRVVEEMGTEVYSSVVIPSPHPDLKKITDRFRSSLDGFLGLVGVHLSTKAVSAIWSIVASNLSFSIPKAVTFL